MKWMDGVAMSGSWTFRECNPMKGGQTLEYAEGRMQMLGFLHVFTLILG